jgi:hypothetical protein
MDLQKWARDALLVQDACNLSGIAHSFSRLMHEMCEAGYDTHERNTHPITLMFVDKMFDLAASGQDRGESNYRHAFAECERLAKGEAA